MAIIYPRVAGHWRGWDPPALRWVSRNVKFEWSAKRKAFVRVEIYLGNLERALARKIAGPEAGFDFPWWNNIAKNGSEQQVAYWYLHLDVGVRALLNMDNHLALLIAQELQNLSIPQAGKNLVLGIKENVQIREILQLQVKSAEELIEEAKAIAKNMKDAAVRKGADQLIKALLQYQKEAEKEIKLEKLEYVFEEKEERERMAKDRGHVWDR